MIFLIKQRLFNSKVIDNLCQNERLPQGREVIEIEVRGCWIYELTWRDDDVFSDTMFFVHHFDNKLRLT